MDFRDPSSFEEGTYFTSGHREATEAGEAGGPTRGGGGASIRRPIHDHLRRRHQTSLSGIQGGILGPGKGKREADFKEPSVVGPTAAEGGEIVCGRRRDLERTTGRRGTSGTKWLSRRRLLQRRRNAFCDKKGSHAT